MNSSSLIGHAERLSKVGTLKLVTVGPPVVGLADALQIGREQYGTRVSLPDGVLPRE
jgi:hypothetical protein